MAIAVIMLTLFLAGTQFNPPTLLKDRRILMLLLTFVLGVLLGKFPFVLPLVGAILAVLAGTVYGHALTTAGPNLQRRSRLP